MNWLLFIVNQPPGSYPIATVIEVDSYAAGEIRGRLAERFNPETRWYCVEKKP